MSKNAKKMIEINSLEALIETNLRTLEGVANETIDNRRASVIFAGSRTVTGALKLGLEAMRLGMNSVAGFKIGKQKLIK